MDRGDANNDGSSVSISGNNAVIEAPHKNLENGDKAAGAAYIYQRNKSGEWAEIQKIVASEAHENDLFRDYVDV